MDYTCGIGIFKPKWLMQFATIKSFMAVYGLLGTIQAMAFVYLVVTLTTLEKRFKIPSKTTGIILTGNEISQILLSLILSYHGAHRNRPRWIAWGVALSAFSCFIVALPHLLYGPGSDAIALTEDHLHIANQRQMADPQAKGPDNQLCISEERPEDCNIQERAGDFSVIPLILVFLSQFILGIGNTLYFSLGQTYLDDNTKKTEMPVLLGWTLALRTLGPAIGFVLAYICLNIYIDPTKVPIIDKKDPRWLGAWWLGWILLGSVMFLFSFLMGLFPKYLPTASVKQLYCKDEALPRNGFQGNVFAEIRKSEIPKFRDFPAALKRLLKNKLLMYNNLSGIFYILGASGYITYISKYLEVQFQESATYTVITGPTMLVGMVAGFLLSGYLITKFKPGPKYLLGWNVVVGLVFIIGQLIFIQLDCPVKDIHSFSSDPKIFKLNSECNSNCSCGNLKYSPVCDSDSQETYFSPCHAGCKTPWNGTKYFTNCSCINETAVVKDGPCLTDCFNQFFIFVLISFIINFMGSSGRIGNLLVNYRSVDIKDKSFAQGLALWMISLFALIPGPIIYGIIIDSTCIVWNEFCGKRGNCYTYNRRKMRVYLNSTAIILTAFGVAIDGIVWYLGRNLNLYESAAPEKELLSKNASSKEVHSDLI